MALDTSQLLDTMQSAARQFMGDAWDAGAGFLPDQLSALAERIAELEAGVASGDVTPPQAKALLAMQVNLTVAAIAAAEVMVEEAAEKAVNAILAVIKPLVNGAIGFPVL